MSNYTNMRIVTFVSLKQRQTEIAGGNAMLSVVDQARNIFGCFAKKTITRQGNHSGTSRAHTNVRCGNKTRSGSAREDREQSNQTAKCGFSKVDPSSSSAAVGVGARFGKYYLEMIANLDQDAVPAPVSPGTLHSESAACMAPNSARMKSFSRIRSLDLGIS